MRYSLWLVLLLFACCKKEKVRYAERKSYFHNLDSTTVYTDTLSVMTYNIQNGFENGVDPWDLQNTGATSVYLDRMTAFLSGTGADIIALQEVPLDRSNTLIKNILDSLGSRLRMNYAFGGHGFNDAYGASTPIKSQWGVAILSKYPIVEMESREVSYENVWERRSTLRARIRLVASLFIEVYCLHHKPMPDQSDLKRSVYFIGESNLPKIVCGDFNVSPSVTLAHLPLQPAWDTQQMDIDQIFHSAQFSHFSLQQYPGNRLSDHTPVLVGLQY